MTTFISILLYFFLLFEVVFSITSIPSSLPALTPDPVNITINTEFPSSLLSSLTVNSYIRIDLKPNVPYGIRDDTPFRIKDSLNFFYQAYEYKYDRLNDEILIFNIKNHLPLRFELQNIFYSGPDQYYVDVDKNVPLLSFLNLTFFVMDNINSNFSIWNQLLKIPFSTENAKYYWFLNYGLNISSTTFESNEYASGTLATNFMYDTADEPNNFFTEPVNVPPNTHYNLTFRIPIPKYRTYTKEGFIRFVPYTAMKGVYQDIFGFFSYDMVIVQEEYNMFALGKKKMIDKYESCWVACEKFNTFSEHTYIQATIDNKTKTIYDFESHKETAFDIEYLDYINEEFFAKFDYFVRGLFPEYTFYFLKIFDEPVTYRQEFIEIKICNLFSISDPNLLGHLGFTLFGGHENFRFRNVAQKFSGASMSAVGSYYMQHEHLYFMSKRYTGIKQYPEILNVKLQEVGDRRINEMRNITFTFNTSILASDWSRFRVVFPESFDVSKLRAQIILKPDGHFDIPYPLNFTYNSTRNSLQFDLRFIYYLNWNERENPASQTPFHYNFSQFSIQLLNFQNPDRITSSTQISDNCSFSHCNFSASASSSVTLIWMPNYWYLWWIEGMYNSFYYMTKRFTTYDSSYWDLVTFTNKVRDYDDFQVLEYVAGEVDIEVLKTRIGGIKIRFSNDVIGERSKWLIEFWSDTQLSLDVAIRLWGINATAETKVIGYLNTYDGKIRQNEDGSIDILEIFKLNNKKNFSIILTNMINSNLTSPLPLAFFNRISMQLIADISYSDYYFENTFLTEKGILLLQPPTINIAPSSLFSSIQLNFSTLHALEYITEFSITLFFPEFFELNHLKSEISLFLNSSIINSNLLSITSNTITFQYQNSPNPIPRNTSFNILIQGIYGYLPTRLQNDLNITILHNNRTISASIPLSPSPISIFPPTSYIVPFNLSNQIFGEKSNVSFYLPCSLLLPTDTLFLNLSTKWRNISQISVLYPVENADYESKIEGNWLVGQYAFNLPQKRFFFDQIKIQVQTINPYREGGEQREEGREEEKGREEEGRSFFVTGIYNLQPSLMQEIRAMNRSEGGWNGDYNYSVITNNEMEEDFGLEIRLKKAFGLKCEGSKVQVDESYEIGGKCERREEEGEEIFWFSNFSFIGLPESFLTITQYAERVLIPNSQVKLIFSNITNPFNKTNREEINLLIQVMQNANVPLQKSSSILSYEISCPSLCESCDKDICLKCSEGAYMFLGDCFDICPLGMYSDSKNCVECKIDKCLECEVGGCKLCMEGYEKYELGCKLNKTETNLVNETIGTENFSNSTNGSLNNNITNENTTTNNTMGISSNLTNETGNINSEFNFTSNISIVSNDTHNCYFSNGIVINCTLATNETNGVNISNISVNNNETNSSNTSNFNNFTNNTENETKEATNNISESNNSVETNNTDNCSLSEGIFINCSLIINETNISNNSESKNESNHSNTSNFNEASNQSNNSEILGNNSDNKNMTNITNNSSMNDNSTTETNSSNNETSNTSESTNSSGENGNLTNENNTSNLANTTNITTNSSNNTITNITNSTSTNATSTNSNLTNQTNNPSNNSNNSYINNTNSTNNENNQNVSNRTDSNSSVNNTSNESIKEPPKNESSNNFTNSSQKNQTNENNSTSNDSSFNDSSLNNQTDKNNSTSNDSSLNSTNASILDPSHQSNMAIKAASILFVNTKTDNQLFLTYYVALTSIIVLIFKIIRKENEAIHVLESLLIFWTLIDPLTTLIFLIKSLLLNYFIFLVPCIALILSFYLFHMIYSFRIARLIRTENYLITKSTSFLIYVNVTKFWNYRIFLLPLTNLVKDLGFSRRSRENLVLLFKTGFKIQIILNTLNICMGIAFIIAFSDGDLPLYFIEFAVFHFLLSLTQFLFIKQKRKEKFEGSALGSLKESEITFATGATSSIPGSPTSPKSPGSPLIKRKINFEGKVLMDNMIKVEEENDEEEAKGGNKSEKEEETVNKVENNKNDIENEGSVPLQEIINYKKEKQITEEKEIIIEANDNEREEREIRRKVEEREIKEEEIRRKSVPKKLSFVDTKMDRKIVETEGDFVLSMSDIEMNIQ